MAATSNLFILFLLVSVVLYYLIPFSKQWILLLIASYFYYVMVSPRAAVFLIYSTAVTWAFALAVSHARIKAGEKHAKKAGKSFFIIGLLLNFGMLAVLKYAGFTIVNLNRLFHSGIPVLQMILPLGISYYTFQSTSYLIDVYWGREKAEKNLFRYALFVSFFPQIAQGPIGRYGRLAPQLAEVHEFSLHQIKYGLERILWGLFKSMLIGGWAAVFADAIFREPEKYSGIAIFGVILYSAELYGNFSGGIDIMIGVASLFGIQLDENFKRPYFADSISDFWRRWHITLGAWMKDYLFFPLNLSKGMAKFGRKMRKIFNKKAGRVIPICISSLIVFLVIGIWHGASWRYIGWGLYNGVIIAFSSLAEGGYLKIKKVLHLRDTAWHYHLFAIIRTFILVNIGWYFDCVKSFGQALTMMRYSVTRFDFTQFLSISSGKLGTAYTPYALATLILAVILLFTVSVLQEKGVHIRDMISRRPFALQLFLCLILLTGTVCFAPSSAVRGFIYAQF